MRAGNPDPRHLRRRMTDRIWTDFGAIADTAVEKVIEVDFGEIDVTKGGRGLTRGTVVVTEDF